MFHCDPIQGMATGIFSACAYPYYMLFLQLPLLLLILLLALLHLYYVSPGEPGALDMATLVARPKNSADDVEMMALIMCYCML